LALRPASARFPWQTAQIRCNGFLLRQLQPKSFKSAPKTPEKIFRIVPVLKAGQKVIGEAKVIGLTATLPAHPSAEPQVQHVVQVDIRQRRRKDRPLRGAFLSGPDQSVFHNAAFQHTDNQSDHTLVPDSMSQKFDHPLMIYLIKRYADLIPFSTTHLKTI
jgi:hypothetical protein